MFTLQEACDILHIDTGVNDTLVYSLINALPDYIRVSTGFVVDENFIDPVAQTLGKFLLTLWYYGDHADGVALQRTIDNLLKILTLKAKEPQPEAVVETVVTSE